MSAKPSLRQIFDEQGTFVWRSLRYLGVADRDLEDQVQEVFVRIDRSLAGFEGRSSLRTWIYGICLRIASDYRRLARVRKEIPVDEFPEAVAPGNGIEARVRARQLLLQALETLDEDKRQVFVLYEVEEMNMAEVVELLGIPLFTGYSRLRLARTRLREHLERQAADE